MPDERKKKPEEEGTLIQAAAFTMADALDFLKEKEFIDKDYQLPVDVVVLSLFMCMMIVELHAVRETLDEQQDDDWKKDSV